MLPQILKLEDTVREYERIGGTIPAEMRFAILMKCLPGQLKTYLQITLQDSTSKEQDDTSGPMDVDRISKGKQKGKNKANWKADF